MQTIKLTLEYDGSSYHGFQRQKNALTIQQCLEKALAVFFQEKITVVSCGRTDSGVHARGHVVSFSVARRRDLARIPQGLNALLPQDIVVVKASRVPLNFHAQFDARSKRYRYVIVNRPFRTPFFDRYAYWIPYPLDITRMRREAAALVGTHDFRHYETAGSARASTVRTVHAVALRRRGEMITIDIEAEGFLYNMARNIAGMLIEVGRGKLAPGTARRQLGERARRLCHFTAPARGLFLMRVRY